MELAIKTLLTFALCSELKRFLNLMHGLRAVLQLLSLAFIQCLSDDGHDAMGTQYAGKTEKHVFFNSMETLGSKAPNI